MLYNRWEFLTVGSYQGVELNYTEVEFSFFIINQLLSSCLSCMRSTRLGLRRRRNRGRHSRKQHRFKVEAPE
jgi:hypothetical protein